MTDRPYHCRGVSTSFVFIAIALACVLIVGYLLIIPRAGTTNAQDSTLDRIKRTGRVRAAYILYPPFVSRDPNTRELSGYFIELMNTIAEEANVSVDYEETTWATMVVGLESDKFDLVATGAFRTIPRAKEVAFTEPVIYVGMSAITRRDDNRVRSAEDLTKPGLSIACINGSASQEYIRKNLPDAKPIVLTGVDFSRPMLEVVAGRADLCIADSASCTRFARDHPDDVRDVFANGPFTYFGASFMVRRRDTDLLTFLNAAVSCLELNGVLSRFDVKYKRQASESSWQSRRKPWR